MTMTRVYLPILFLLILIAGPVFAKGSIIDVQKSDLQKSMQEIHSPKELAGYLAALEADFSNYDNQLRLYLASKWFDQRFVKSSQTIMQMIDAPKKYADLWMYMKVVLALNEKKSQQAEVYLEKLLNRHPQDLNILFLKSVYLADVGHLKPAIDTLTTLLKKDRRNGEYYLQRGVYRLVALNNDDALEDFRKAAKYLPKHEISKRQQALLQMGVIYYRHKFNKVKGQKYIQKGVDLDPNSELVRQLQKTLRF